MQRPDRDRAANPPAQAEQSRTDHQGCIDPIVRRHMEAVVKYRTLHPLHHLHAGEGDDDRAAKNERQAWVPGAEDVEETLDSDRI
jgi:hypothetical protein